MHQERVEGWVVVVPVKRLELAKTRLRGVTVEPERLALALVLDAMDAAFDSPRVVAVVVVTADPEVAARASARGARVVHEPDDSDLNRAADLGISQARLRWPGSGVAVMPSDLPALGGVELTGALALAGRHPLAVVPDAEGVGSTLITARPDAALVARFGGASAARHEVAGHVRLELPAGSAMRRDVDTAADLEAALALGVGRHTRAALG